MALDFFFSTEGKVGREDLERAAVKVLGHSLPASLVSASCCSILRLLKACTVLYQKKLGQHLSLLALCPLLLLLLSTCLISFTPVGQVDIICGVYATDDGHLQYRDLLYAIQKREGNMIYSKQMLELDPTSDKSMFACMRSCLFPGLGK